MELALPPVSGDQMVLQRGRPVGLLQAAVGGSPVQSWISPVSPAAHPRLAHLVAGKIELNGSN